jgi:hypothetical protein
LTAEKGRTKNNKRARDFGIVAAQSAPLFSTQRKAALLLCQMRCIVCAPRETVEISIEHCRVLWKELPPSKSRIQTFRRRCKKNHKQQLPLFFLSTAYETIELFLSMSTLLVLYAFKLS